MTLPSGITTCTVTKSPPRDIQGNAGSILSATVRADRDLVWAATGETLYGVQDVDLTLVGDGLSFPLPHVDQAGFLDANSGEPVTNWYYTVTVQLAYGGSRRQTDTYRLQVITGQAALDLDVIERQGTVLPSVTAPSPKVTSVAGRTGVVSAEDVASDVAATSAFDAAIAEQVPVAGAATFAPFSAQYGVMSRVRSKMPPSKVLTTFQAGHGFTTGSADASSNVNDTVNHDLGAQAATLVTTGNGTVATLGNGAVTAVNLTGQQVRIRLRGTNLLHVTRFEVYAGSGGGFTNRYTWGAGSGNAGLMRAEVNGAVNYSRDGEWVDLDLSFADAIVTGTPDRTAINAWQIRVADDNTGQKVTINVQGIYAVPKSSTFPNGVVSFTWDDSVLDPVTLAKPLMDTYGFLSTYYAIIDVIGTTQGGVSYMSLAQMQALYDQGNDIAPHCTTLARHSSAGGMMDLTADQLDAEFRTLKAWAKTQGFTRSADLFATPQGKFTPAMIQQMKRYFSSHRSTVYFSRETIRPSDVMRLRCIPLPGSGSAFTVAQCTAAIDTAYAEGAWVIFMGHQIVSGASASSLQCTQADFNTICNYVATKGMPVRTVSAVLSDMA